MLSYCLKYNTDTDSINPKVSKTSNERICNYQNVQCAKVKNQNLLKKLEESELLSKVEIKTFFIKIPILGDILF